MRGAAEKSVSPEDWGAALAEAKVHWPEGQLHVRVHTHEQGRFVVCVWRPRGAQSRETSR